MIAIPAAFEADLDAELALEAVVATYGEPCLRSVSLAVTQDTLAYWQRVRSKRLAEVVLILPDDQGNYLVHTKAFYPPGAYRLLSGGIHPGEALRAAVLREAYEETGQQVAIERFVGVLWTSFEHQDQVARFASYLFLLKPVDGEIRSLDAKEQISDYRFVSLADLARLTDDLEALPADWLDWGRFRAEGHRLCLDALNPA